MPSMPGTWHDVAFMSFNMALMPSDVVLMPMTWKDLDIKNGKFPGAWVGRRLRAAGGKHLRHLYITHHSSLITHHKSQLFSARDRAPTNEPLVSY
eukprot:scaffold24383_cov39-Cyclotella_meneghiniana.AAC.7